MAVGHMVPSLVDCHLELWWRPNGSRCTWCLAWWTVTLSYGGGPMAVGHMVPSLVDCHLELWWRPNGSREHGA